MHMINLWMLVLATKKNIEEDINQEELPEGWVRTTINEITHIVEKIKPEETPDKVFYYCDIDSIDNHKFKINNPKKFVGKDAPSRARQLIKKDDVLFSTVRTYLKNIARVPDVLDSQLASTGFCVIRSLSEINSIFIFNYVQSEKFLNTLNRKQRGVSYPAVRNSDVLTSMISFPPLSEQKRIVSKIESIFAQIDAAKEKLEVLASQTKLASGSLSMLRSSVLKQAFEGKLVPQDPKDESASVLLEKIRKENPNLKQSDYEEIEQENLPEGWFAVQFHFITKNFDHQRIPVSKNKRREMQGNIPYYGASGVIDHVNRSIFDGDYLLIGEDGANLLARTTPIAFIAKGKFWINNHAHILKTLGNIPLEFLTSYINSINLAPWVTGTAQPKLNQSNLNKIPIPIPSLSEQKRIVSKIESIFAKIDVVHEIVQSELKKLDRLRQSVLKQAFEGKLVPQDPNDEHANILLKRIKKERIEQKEVKRGIKNVK